MENLPTDPRRAFREGITHVLHGFGSHGVVARAGTEALATSPDVRAVWSAFMQKWIDQTAALIEAERDRGAAPVTIPARDLATSLNLMNERMMTATLVAEEGAVAADRIVDTLAHIWLTSIYGDSSLVSVQSRRSRCEHRLVSACRAVMRACVGRRDASFWSASGAATILHADLDSFYASVEQRDDPSLRGRPVIVGGGVVLAASYEAKAYGVRTAMGGRQARQLCPHAIVVPPRMSAYSEASAAVFEVFHDTTPLVEPLSVDEAFLDVGGLAPGVGHPGADRGAAARAGARARRPADHGRHRPHQVPRQGGQPGGQARRAAAGAARPRVGLPAPAAGAAAVGRRRQDRREAARPRHPHRRRRGRAERVHARARSSAAAMGRQLFALSHNIDRRRVVTGVRRRSVGAQRALGRAGNTMSHSEIDAVVVNLVDRITRRMRRSDRTGRTVVLRLRFDDFGRVTRSHTLPRATASTDAILSAARDLVAAAAPLIAERGLTLVGFAVSNIDRDGAQQLAGAAVRASGEAAGRRLAADLLAVDSAMDEVRQRFGNASVTRGVLIGRDPGLEMPMLPD